MADERDANTGQYNEQYPRKAFLTAITTTDPPTTSNIADAVGCSYDLAYRRLTNLADTDHVTNTDVGGTYLWHRD
ncbi:transcriptional regulator [Halorubellus sp. PRR65]|uniref:transcriptional regulator n=1 Tax=Halorubellus sp. PRR65 TaxID=3098148 RepID=UPI002B25CE31|nr:transcriptional regulator [Halorubellus sp. PRR65]